MNRKISTLLLATIIMMLAVASNVLAQNYSVYNGSPVTVTVYIQGTCPGPPPTTWVLGPFTILPGGGISPPVPPPPCMITDVTVNGILYPVGYDGPAFPSNPPTWVIVNPFRTIIW